MKQSLRNFKHLASGLLTVITVAFVCTFLSVSTCDALTVNDEVSPEKFIEMGAQHPEVCQIILTDLAYRYTGTGSGTLIAPNVILTAAHVVERACNKYQKHGNLVQPILPCYVSFKPMTDFSKSINENDLYNASRIIIHPHYQGCVGLKPSKHDLALIVLDRAVKDIVPAKIYNKTGQAVIDLMTKLQKGLFECLAIGYGMNCITEENIHVKLAAFLPKVTMHRSNLFSALYSTEKNKNRKQINFVNNKLVKSLFWGFPLPGDSGGPIKITLNNSEGISVVGVASFIAKLDVKSKSGKALTQKNKSKKNKEMSSSYAPLFNSKGEVDAGFRQMLKLVGIESILDDRAKRQSPYKDKTLGQIDVNCDTIYKLCNLRAFIAKCDSKATKLSSAQKKKMLLNLKTKIDKLKLANKNLAFKSQNIEVKQKAFKIIENCQKSIDKFNSLEKNKPKVIRKIYKMHFKGRNGSF